MVDNAVFSETALKIFLIFCIKLGDYKGRRVTDPDFWKKFLSWRYSRKGFQISPKWDTDIFLKNGSNDFFCFWPEISTKCDIQFQWNLFFTRLAIWRYLTSKPLKKNVQTGVFGHFLDFASLVFLNFIHNDRWAWCLVVFLQFAGPANVFLLL